MNKFLNKSIDKSFYDQILDAANRISKNKSGANCVITTGRCNCCGKHMDDENSVHDPECIWYKEKIIMKEITDKDRMDFLVSHQVEVRIPLQYGSHQLFVAQETSEDWEDYENDLRLCVDYYLEMDIGEKAYRCPHCGRLHLCYMTGYEPWSNEHYMCHRCHSTYNINDPVIVKTLKGDYYERNE